MLRETHTIRNGRTQGESLLPANIVHTRMHLQENHGNQIDIRFQEKRGPN
jgi:hypothetical protein